MVVVAFCIFLPCFSWHFICSLFFHGPRGSDGYYELFVAYPCHGSSPLFLTAGTPAGTRHQPLPPARFMTIFQCPPRLHDSAAVHGQGRSKGKSEKSGLQLRIQTGP
ncbi:hypothetical protein QBC39DRAFT_120556 [Podospora conica]|nr:hypothetical protein QBC39DRAFT_120556 [Schizothecium conicum]